MVYIRLLYIVAQGNLDGLLAAGPDWRGWGFKCGKLYSPEGVEISAGEIRAIPYLRALVAEYKRRCTSWNDDRGEVLPISRRGP